MFHQDGSRHRTWKGRAFSLFLAAALLLGSVPGFILPSSAHWADPYLDQLVDWGVMRADQTANPDTPLTRAEFMAIINRAYGYHEIGEMPFEDVTEGDWFYDDVAIAYNAGYMKGTSKTTASPNANLTREQAVCILGRNMMMKETPGEDLAFTDSRSISNWAKGMVKTAVNQYIIGGFPDDTFRPKDNITKGQMAVLMTQCVGNPVSQSGAYELGDVSGNLTITAPNVTLRNTTVSGDLYVSGGVGLGGIKLENVNVLGRIVVSGTGESEAGGASVVMRNVTANEMLVDNMRDKTVTIRADGITEIPKTVVRTSAYIEDNNTDDKGLMSIELDGDSGSRLTLAGRIKEVVDKTPNSLIQAAKGTVAKLTVDEAAVNANVQLDRNTSVKELNLDVAANVTGDGDIDQLNVNAAGSVVSMLPDKIYIRPGLTGNIAGVVMDHTDAEEGSLDPRLLSGYPAARDITPTGLRADFSGNKKGTVYWAVSSITDGSIGEDDLISPPSYGSKAIRSGSVALPTGGSEVSAQVTGLTVGGSYYLSAILVDDLGNRSPVKTISFSTPDNTVPAFGQGYPYMSFVGRANEYDNGVTAQVAVMATKTCRMYYAVLPAGAAAPTADELRSASVSSNMGYGVVELEKNDVWDGDRAIIVSRRLAEQKDYVLYLWLTDGVNSSEVTSLAITTPDVTAPYFVSNPRVNGDAQATSVPMTATINEDGTIYWVAVKSGADYPLPNPSNDKENTEDGKTARLDSEYAKIQVANGMNAVSRGSVTAQANTPVTNLNITGLQAETSYDVYFLVRDTAGNDARSVYKVEGGIRTLDTGAPTVRQIFTKFDGTDNSLNPMRDTDIILEFSENIRFGSNGKDLLSLYQATQEGTASEKEKALDEFVDALRSGIDFKVSKFGIPQSAVLGNPGVESDEWAIDFSSAVVANVNGAVQITFPNSGLKLDSGGIYNFEFNNLEDLSEHPMKPEGEKLDYSNDEENGHKIPQFTVVFARISLTDILPLPDDQLPEGIVNANYPGAEGGYRADFKFRMIPDDMESVSDDISYDMLIWNDCNEGIMYDLYFRAVTDSGRVLTVERDTDGNFLYGMPNMSTKVHALDKSGWIRLGSSGEHFFNSELSGKSLQGQFNQCTEQSYPKLKKLLAKTEDTGEKVYYDFIISVRSMKGQTDPRAWSGEVNFYVDIAAGVSSTLAGMGVSPLEASWATFVREGLNSSRGGESIGSPNKSAGTSYPDRNRLHMSWDYRDTVQPIFGDGFPKFVNIGEDSATMNLLLNRDGTVFYVIGYADVNGSEPADTTRWQPSITSMTAGGELVRPENVPRSGDERDKLPDLISPSKLQIQQPSTLNTMIVDSDKAACKGGNVTQVPIEKLEPNRTYYVYLVITGAGAEPSEVEMYKFKTNPISRPVITINADYSTTPARASMSTDIPSTLTYKVYAKSVIQEVSWMSNSKHLSDSDILNPAYRGQLPLAYQTLTVYDALAKPYSYNEASVGSSNASAYFPTDGSGNPSGFDKRYSVFDIYASDSAKSKLRTWLEVNAVSAGLTGDEPIVADPGTKTNVAANGRVYSDTVIEWSLPYYVLTMACRNPLDTNASDNSIGLYYSFMGYETTPNTTAPPKLQTASGDFTLNDAGTVKDGYITLVFDKALYTGEGVNVEELKKEKLAEMFNNADCFDFDKSSVTNDTTQDTCMIRLVLNPGSGNVSTSVLGTAWIKNSKGIGARATLEISSSDWMGNEPVINVKWDDLDVNANDKTIPITGKKEQPVDLAPPELNSTIGSSFNVTDVGYLDGGQIRLQFTKPLFVSSGSEVVAIDGDTFITLGSTPKPAWADTVTVENRANESNVTINLAKESSILMTNQTLEFTLKTQGNLKNASGIPATKDLKISFVYRTEPQGTLSDVAAYYLIIQWGDGTPTEYKGTIGK